MNLRKRVTVSSIAALLFVCGCGGVKEWSLEPIDSVNRIIEEHIDSVVNKHKGERHATSPEHRKEAGIADSDITPYHLISKVTFTLADIGISLSVGEVKMDSSLPPIAGMNIRK